MPLSATALRTYLLSAMSNVIKNFSDCLLTPIDFEMNSGSIRYSTYKNHEYIFYNITDQTNLKIVR